MRVSKPLLLRTEQHGGRYEHGRQSPLEGVRIPEYLLILGGFVGGDAVKLSPRLRMQQRKRSVAGRKDSRRKEEGFPAIEADLLVRQQGRLHLYTLSDKNKLYTRLFQDHLRRPIVHSQPETLSFLALAHASPPF